MKALVTGATGFVGGHLVEALHRRGDEVTALVRSPAKAGQLPALSVRQVAGDLHSPEALAEALAGQDTVFHVAGLVAARNEAEFFRANRDGTANLVAAVRRSRGNTRLVLVSSMAAGGPALRDVPMSGEEPAQPVTQYGRSKLAAEEVVRASRLAWSIVRPPMVYGPRDRELLRVFKLARLGVVPIFGDGTQQLSAVYAPDLAEALIAVGASNTAAGRIYYACHPEVFTSAELVRLVARAVAPAAGHDAPDPPAGPVRTISFPAWAARAALTLTSAAAAALGRTTILTPDKAREFFQPAWTGNPTALYRDAGWQAAHDLETGLMKTVEWYRT
ncbi:MAG: NAD-dependent epimerase/dehydratase family protein, partial [Gemmatimonadales bacterium]